MKKSEIFVTMLLLIAGNYMNAQIQLDSIRYDMDTSYSMFSNKMELGLSLQSGHLVDDISVIYEQAKSYSYE
jgi:hypothetical protein